MAKVIVNAWIPRSHLHVFEIQRSLKKFDLEISDVKTSEGISFKIKDVDGVVDFHLDTTGQYSLSKNFKSMGEALEFIERAKKTIRDSIIRNSHGVTHKQIENGSLPLCFSSAIVSKTRPENLERKKILGRDVFYDLSETYVNDSIIYVSGDSDKRSDEIVKYICFLAICNRFLFSMMDRMESCYHEADKIVDLLESKISLKELRETIFDFDLIKKESGESYSKIDQMRNNIDAKSESFSGGSKVIEDWFIAVDADWRYVLTLWELLINYLDNVDSAAEARMTYQETVESRRIEGFLSLETASVIAYLILGIFVSNFTGVWGIVLIAVFLVAWLVLYEFLMKYKKKIRLRRTSQ
jgi:hypothetical protein